MTADGPASVPGAAAKAAIFPLGRPGSDALASSAGLSWCQKLGQKRFGAAANAIVNPQVAVDICRGCQPGPRLQACAGNETVNAAAGLLLAANTARWPPLCLGQLVILHLSAQLSLPHGFPACLGAQLAKMLSYLAGARRARREAW